MSRPSRVPKSLLVAITTVALILGVAFFVFRSPSPTSEEVHKTANPVIETGSFDNEDGSLRYIAGNELRLMVDFANERADRQLFIVQPQPGTTTDLVQVSYIDRRVGQKVQFEIKTHIGFRLPSWVKVVTITALGEKQGSSLSALLPNRPISDFTEVALGQDVTGDYQSAIYQHDGAFYLSLNTGKQDIDFVKILYYPCSSLMHGLPLHNMWFAPETLTPFLFGNNILRETTSRKVYGPTDLLPFTGTPDIVIILKDGSERVVTFKDDLAPYRSC